LIPILLFAALTFPATGAVRLPPGTIEVDAEIRLPEGAHDLEISGQGTTLRASAKFRGRAILSCHGCRNLRLRNFAVDGNRAALEKPLPLPPTDWTFERFYPNNGLLFENCDGLFADRLHFRQIANFAILVTASRRVSIEHATVRDSGSRNAKGRNNTSGGILLEEGTEDFRVLDSSFVNIRGNALWTHSRYRSPRNLRGRFVNNRFTEIGRDAIQVGHAAHVEVSGNIGARIGFPVEIVDLEGLGNPVGIDSAGNVDHGVYANNQFSEIDGKCIDLDGFHDGAVRGNVCINRGAPEAYPFGNFGIAMNNASVEMHSANIRIEDNRLEGMKFGAMFVLGSGHRILRNRMRRLNTAHCNETHARFGCLALPGEPGFLESGIYISDHGEKPDPARHIVIEGNIIGGYKMAAHCIEAAPGVKLSENTLTNNHCFNE
jgi:hypothetical protein